ncbi:FAD-binding oxidoreductase [Kitasatospora sp. RB6PN24]|uniref:FAD-binding oxidoreductase n=1 Tax=Kitasatospora humi TaxID=2893891 RepID=UPI001E3F003F|nr:FAD-binding oxidoreductase [Kitasatospora humi]MCC9306300.1 FAD-binding oxidoreductase [Kitasatospora humi]
MTIDRRRLLTALGAAGAMVMTGARGAAAHPGPGSRGGSDLAPTLNAWPGRPRGTAAAPPDWKALKARLGSRLVLPGDSAYSYERLGFNELNDGQLPAAIARCASAGDVQACLDVARGHGIPIAARSGGHSYLGYSIPNGGLVIDLRYLNQVRVLSDGTALVGAGARLIEVYAGLAQAGRLLPAGSCPTVGVAGLTQGGGIGVLTRKYGLTCDRLSSARLVTADSKLRLASPDSEPQLYWALRGGGGGNFGVVTQFAFRTEAAPPLTVFVLTFPPGSAADTIGAWQSWAGAAPFELWSSCQIAGGTPPTVKIVGCYVGDQKSLTPLIDQLVRAAGAQPTRLVESKDYLDAMKFMAGCASDTIAQCHPTWEGGTLPRASFVAESRMLPPAPLDAGKVAALMVGHSGVFLLLDVLGGAVARLAPDATAFPHRHSLASAQIYADTTRAGYPATKKAVDAIRDGLAALGATGAYVNYIDATLPHWGQAYYGINLPKLKKVAEHYDPDRVFAFPQSVVNAT